MVTHRQVQSMARALQGVLLLLLLAIPLTGLHFWRAQPPAPDLNSERAPDAAQTNATKTTRPLTWYAPLWERDLKQPPIPPQVALSAPETKPTRPTPTLIATFVERGIAFAHLRRADGKVELKGVSETIDGFLVAAIEPGRVLLENGESTIWVELPKEAQR
jgi:hypothetical protein